MKVLLMTPPEGLKNQKVIKPPFGVQPLGIFYLDSYLKKHVASEIETRIYDAYTIGSNQQDIYSAIEEFRPDVVGVSSTTILIYDAQMICTIAKQVSQSIVTVLGGPHISSYPASVDHKDVDFGVFAEGEITFTELIETIAGTGGVGNIRGLIWKQESELVVNPPRKPIADLDSIPFPDPEQLISKIYNPLPTWGRKGKFCAMVTSRGCPYYCSYCSVTETQGQKYRYNSARWVFEEVKVLHGKYGVTDISFRDGTFTTSKSRVYEFCDLLASENIRLNWTCNTRANELDEDLLRKLKEGGCKGIFLGIEHGNEELMWKHKKLRKKDVTRTVNLASDIGLDVQGYFMLGMPDETVENILETLDYAKEMPLNTAAFTIATPYPGTKLYRECKQKGLLIHQQWNKYDARLGLTWKHPTISDKEMVRLMKKCYRGFYLRPRIIFERIKRLKSPQQLLGYIYLMKQFLK